MNILNTRLKELKELKNKEHIKRLETIKKEGFSSVTKLQAFHKENDKNESK